MNLEFISNSAQETFELGRKIAEKLKKGSVVALRGELGSGKTVICKGIAGALGIDDNLTSPTYTIINEYIKDASAPLYHIDLYRLSNEKDFEDIGGEEIIQSGGICLIEWSERIAKSLPENTITVSLEIKGPSSRLIKIKGLKEI